MLNETGGRGRSVAIALKAIGLVSAVAISLLVVFWPYVVAWLTIHEPTADERRAYFETVRHRGGVPAPRAERHALARGRRHCPGRGITLLSRELLPQVGPLGLL
jgi:hypothetical protein